MTRHVPRLSPLDVRRVACLRRAITIASRREPTWMRFDTGDVFTALRVVHRNPAIWPARMDVWPWRNMPTLASMQVLALRVDRWNYTRGEWQNRWAEHAATAYMLDDEIAVFRRLALEGYP